MAFDCLNIYGLCNKLCQKVLESMMTRIGLMTAHVFFYFVLSIFMGQSSQI